MTSIDELSAMEPQTQTITLAGGTQVVIERLRARQFFKLLRIVTHGAMPALNTMNMLPDPNGDRGEFVTKLLSMVVLSIPDAEEETLDFIASMCTPVGLRPGGRKASKEDVEYNASLWTSLGQELHNPELDDLVTIIEAVIRAESDDIQALGKRLAALFRLAEKTGQVPNTMVVEDQNPSTTSNSSGVSVELTTSSAASTAGATTPSETSLSGDSDNA